MSSEIIETEEGRFKVIDTVEEVTDKGTEITRQTWVEIEE